MGTRIIPCERFSPRHWIFLSRHLLTSLTSVLASLNIVEIENPRAVPGIES